MSVERRGRAARRRRVIQHHARVRSVPTVGVHRFGENREQIYIWRSDRSGHRDRAPGRPETGHVAMQCTHTPKVISRREQIPRDHVIGAAWAHQQDHGSQRKIGTCIEFEIVAGHLRVRSIRPIHKEWKPHTCSACRRHRRYACRNRGGVRDLHSARRRRKTAHAVRGNGAYSIIDRERISPQRAGLRTEVDRLKLESQRIGKRRFVIRFEDIRLSIYHRRPLDIETLTHVELRVVERRDKCRRGGCWSGTGDSERSHG